MSFAIGMIACKRECMTTDAAVAALRGGGFPETVTVFAEPDVDDLAEGAGVRLVRNPVRLGGPLNYLRAIRWLLEHTGEAYVLLVEDDVAYCRGARDALAALVLRRRLGYASLHTPNRERDRVGARAGWLRLPIGRIWGTQAVCFSRWTLEHFVHDPALHAGLPTYDYVVQRFYSARGWPCYYHAPSLADHVGWSETTLGRQTNVTEARRGLGFDPAWTPPAALPGA